jgi:hypothetical protein
VYIGVSGRIGEIAGSVASKTARERHAIARGVISGKSKSIITRDFGGAVRGSVRLFDGPRADRSRSSQSIKLDELRVSVCGHDERKVRRATTDI